MQTSTHRACTDVRRRADEIHCLQHGQLPRRAHAACYRVVYNGDLYKVLKAHTAQDTWLPGAGTESLYTRIDEQHDGTKYDPIPYSGNMTLEAGKYYTQSGKTYLCNRDTGSPVYHALSELVGMYV